MFGPDVSLLKAVEQVISTADKDPAKAWGLLMERPLVFHPDRIRLVCRVCRIALDRGMAPQVRRLNALDTYA